MKVTSTALEGVLILEPRVFGDERGFFMESFNQRVFDEAVGRHVTFVQDNHSRSQRGVLRGLHFQLPPHEQGKLVRVVSGCVFDVAVDMRRRSPTFGRWVGVELSAENHRQLWIPPGFAHGFLVRSDSADFLYKTTGYYAAQAEACVRWDDATIGIDWGLGGATPLLSPKDAAAPSLDQAPAFDAVGAGAGPASPQASGRVDRPWGWFDSIEAGPGFQVKRIHVNPGASLSLQSHAHRSENWVVVQGRAEVTQGDRVLTIGPAESVFIAQGQKHRLANRTASDLEIIEVQTGSYLGEDDIVRYEDAYGRT